jgi:hypothetical protein
MPLDAFQDMDIPIGDSGFAVFAEGASENGPTTTTDRSDF